MTWQWFALAAYALTAVIAGRRAALYLIDIDGWPQDVWQWCGIVIGAGVAAVWGPIVVASMCVAYLIDRHEHRAFVRRYHIHEYHDGGSDEDY